MGWPGNRSRLGSQSGKAQRPIPAQFLLAESFETMTNGIRQRQVQPIMRHLVELEGATRLEPKPAAEQDERDVVQGVRVAFAQLVGPHNRRVIEHAA